MTSRRIYRLNRQGNLLWLRASVGSFANGLLGIDFLREEKAIIDIFKGEIALSNT